MIRRATTADLEEVVEQGRAFLAYSPHRWIELDEIAFEAAAEQMITGNGAIFLAEDGFIGGILVPCYFNPSVTFASELFWYAPNGGGQELLAAFEEWARESGADAVTCSGLADSHERAIRRVYGRAGYHTSEIAFMKRIA